LPHPSSDIPAEVLLKEDSLELSCAFAEASLKAPQVNPLEKFLRRILLRSSAGKSCDLIIRKSNSKGIP